MRERRAYIIELDDPARDFTFEIKQTKSEKPEQSHEKNIFQYSEPGVCHG